MQNTQKEKQEKKRGENTHTPTTLQKEIAFSKKRQKMQAQVPHYFFFKIFFSVLFCCV